METALGVFVGLLGGDITKSPEEATLFMECLRKSNIDAHYTQWAMARPGEEESGVNFDLYVARPFW
jgi:hypothetical protein